MHCLLHRGQDTPRRPSTVAMLQFCIQHPFGVILRNVKRLNNAAIPETVPVALCLLKFLEFLRRFVTCLGYHWSSTISLLEIIEIISIHMIRSADVVSVSRLCQVSSM